MTEISKHNINTLITDDVKDFFKARQKVDLEFGITNEIEILDILKQHFNDSTIAKTSLHNVFDFVGDNKLIELKTRRCTSNYYPTTMIGMNKILNCKSNIKFYFVFKFTDKIMYCEYNKDDFESFEKKKMGRNDRGRVEQSLYCLIPISYLTEF